MLTKKDLAMLQGMFTQSETKITTNILQQVQKMLQSNTNQIVELISSLYNTHEGVLNNHEKRHTYRKHLFQIKLNSFEFQNLEFV